MVGEERLGPSSVLEAGGVFGRVAGRLHDSVKRHELGDSERSYEPLVERSESTSVRKSITTGAMASVDTLWG